MTSEESAQDKELLERYRRASSTETAAPSEAVRAAILAEGRRVAELRAKESAGQKVDLSRPAANDSRWKITAFGTAGAALVAALLFAPRLWEGMPPAPAVSNTSVASTDQAAPSESGAARSPKAESLPSSPNSSEPPQEVIVTQTMRKSQKATEAASPQFSTPAAPAAQEPTADEMAAPKSTALQPRSDLPAPPERPRAEALARSAASAEKIYPRNFTQAAPPNDAKAGSTAPVLSSLNAAHVASPRESPQPAALLSAAASGDTVQTTALLDQGAALEARDELGRTPLMLAVMQRKPEVVRLLLDRGADPNVADSAGRTPLQQAKQQNLREIAALLQRAGAR
jgi:Ankyrin repeats (many copies)